MWTPSSARLPCTARFATAEEKAKAESVAKKIDGVLEVRNLLQVVTPQREKAVQLSDDAL